MHHKKCDEIKLPIEEQFVRAIVASKNKSIVNVSYEREGNITVINFN
jgi:hypothetical protein